MKMAEGKANILQKENLRLSLPLAIGVNGP
jgi:hypothetical protein